MTCAGGSSKVLSNAAKALFESMCTSSIMNTLYLLECGEKRIFSIMCSRTLSTPVCEAASISTTSKALPERNARQLKHSWHGSLVPAARPVQLTVLAKRRATVVLPTPRGPHNKYAWAIIPLAISDSKIIFTVVCPIIADQVSGRCLVWRAIYLSFQVLAVSFQLNFILPFSSLMVTFSAININ